MSNLQLVTTEKFGEIDCNFYRNMNDEILLTREQIGSALEYSNPQKAIDKIHERHKNRLDNLSVTVKLGASDGKQYNTCLYNERGIMEICRWSDKPKANQFMDWCWDVIEKYRHGNLENNNNMLINDITKNVINLLNPVIMDMQNKLQLLAYNQKQQSPKMSKYSKWKNCLNRKIKLLSDYLNKTPMTILSNLYIEIEDCYDVDLIEYKNYYIEMNQVENCSQLDVIEFNSELRKMMDCTLDSLLEKYNIKYIKDNKRKTIFDDEVIVEVIS